MVAASSGRREVADNIITTRRGFRAVSRAEPDHVFCHPVVVQDIDTSDLGLPLPWSTVGAAR